MKTAFGTLLVWALFLAALTGLQFAFMVSHISYGLLGGAALLVTVLGILAFWRRRFEDTLRFVPDSSFAALLAAVAFAGAGIGVALGPLFFLPGLGLLVLALAGVARELLAGRGDGR